MQKPIHSIMLVDGYSLLFRGFHALPLLTAPDGTYTNALQGFFSMLFKALNEYRPDTLCVMLDVHAPTFRHTLYDAYKGTRKPMPEELRPQIPVLKELLEAMRIRTCFIEGYEADDLLGTGARLASEQGILTYLLTGDRDSLQLVDELTRVVLTKTGISESLLLDREQMISVFGYTPEMVPDLKGLMGDSSDNIPGIAGVGEKTALKLLGEYGTLDNVLAHAGEVKGKLGGKLQNGRDAALLSRDLGTIRRNAPLDLHFEDCTWQEMTDGLPMLEKYRLTRLAQMLRSLLEGGDSVPTPSGARLSAAAKRSGATEKVAPSRALPADEPPELPVFPALQEAGTLTESSAIVSICAELAAQNEPVALYLNEEAISLCARDGRLWRMPILRDLMGGGLYEDQIMSAMQGLFASSSLVAHGAKTLLHSLARYGLPLPSIHRDTMLGAYLLHATQKGFDLPASLAAEYGVLTEQPPTAWDLYALSVRQDAVLSHRGMLALLTDMEQPLTQVLFEMERLGFGVDVEVLSELGILFTTEIERLRGEVLTLMGVEEFNLNSPRQLGEVLFDKLGLPSGKKSKGGAYSTDASVLEGLAPYHPSIEPLLRYRKLSKLQSTYVDGLRKLTDRTGRVHTTFDQTATLTGRISSLEPNLQNIPIRSEEGREIRRAFVAREGCILLDADYSQIELRVLAHLSGDPAMQDAFRRGQDIHTRTAAEIHGVPMEDVTPAMRRSAKAVNFGIVYGISGFGLARNAGISRKEADGFIAAYFERYPGVRAYMDRMVKQGYELGYTETLFARRRELPELLSSNRNVRNFGERAAMNTPVQGTAADIIKLAMVRVRERLMQEGFEARLILQVHDELVVECPPQEQERVSVLLREAMENVVKLDVPLVADVSAGKDWNQAH